MSLPNIKDSESLEELDKSHLWHPFTQMSSFLKEEPLIIKEAKGVILKDIYGNEYLDGVSSLWCNIHGHKKKEIDKAIKSQLKQVAHSTLLGASNIPSIILAKKLVEIAPKGLQSHSPLTKVFYSDNGSTAVEVALKMAFQYWQQTGFPEKKKFLALQYGYHGDTLGAMAVGGVERFHNLYRPLTFHALFAPSPYCYRCPLGKSKETCALACLEEMEKILVYNHNEITGLVIEPLVQGAGGMIVHPQGYLKSVRELCNKYKVLLIADEILTGFGRTGRMFACEHEGVVPDILAISKGLTGGYLPLAATLVKEDIYNAFLGDYDKTFFHGHTYTGNPLACAAAIANLEVFEKESVLKNLQPKVEFLQKTLKDFYALEHVGDVRQCGFVVGIELVRDKQTKEPFPSTDKIGYRVTLEARKRGALLRPLADVIVIMPPLAINLDQLDRLLSIICNSINVVSN